MDYTTYARRLNAEWFRRCRIAGVEVDTGAAAPIAADVIAEAPKFHVGDVVFPPGWAVTALEVKPEPDAFRESWIVTVEGERDVLYRAPTRVRAKCFANSHALEWEVVTGLEVTVRTREAAVKAA